MAYTKTVWVNSSAPAINATNLNKIEDGIFNNDAAITTASGTVSTLTTNFNNHVLESSHVGGRFYAYKNLGGAL
jgi:hypothetical protein